MRAFAELAKNAPPSRLHETLIATTHEDRLVGHISRDGTAIEGREKPPLKIAKNLPSPRNHAAERRKKTESTPIQDAREKPPSF